jgi:glycosyltransferase involved in cell wall biosynthesis
MTALLRFDLLNPKVTIGICGRNCADFVVTALESAANQDFPHDSMEIVFVNDGSEDNTLEVVKNYLSKKDIAWRVYSYEWQGLGKSRNIVLDNALGDYIVWLDTDETLANDYVRKQVNIVEKNPRAGIVAGRLGIFKNENLTLTLDLLPSVVEYSRQDWKGKSKYPGTGGATYRTVAARQTGGFDEELSGLGEDIEMASRIRDAGWLIIRGDGVFFESHSNLSGWVDLIKRSAKQGVHSRRLYRKTNKFYSLLRINPFASAIAGVLYAVEGYKVTRKKIVFFLPFHFGVKMLVWFYGFCQG